MRVLRGHESEATALWPLVDTFVQTAGRGVMKVLLPDGGFINDSRIGRLKQDYGIDTVIPIRSDMDLFEDVRGLTQLSPPWEEYEPTRRASLPGVRPGHTPHPLAQNPDSCLVNDRRFLTL